MRGLRLLFRYLAREFRRDVQGLRTARTPGPASLIVLMILSCVITVAVMGWAAMTYGTAAGSLLFGFWTLRSGILRPVGNMWPRLPTRWAYYTAGAGWSASTAGWFHATGFTPQHTASLAAAGFTPNDLSLAAEDLYRLAHPNIADSDHAPVNVDPTYALSVLLFTGHDSSSTRRNLLLRLPARDGTLLMESGWNLSDLERILVAHVPPVFAAAWTSYALPGSAPTVIDTWMLMQQHGVDLPSSLAWLATGPETVLALRRACTSSRIGPPPRPADEQEPNCDVLRRWNDLLGARAPAWFAAGVSLDEAEVLVREGETVDDDALRAFAALRGSSPEQ